MQSDNSELRTLPQIHLLFGFLGAGKTTLVRNLLQTADPDYPTAVIVNEFGDVGIDGDIIQGNTIDTVELASGCICCTLKGSLMNAIEELANDKGAKRIVVEATGVADPEDMLDDLEDSTIAEKMNVAPIVVVVDASYFNKVRPMLGEFYVSQVLNADIVIINKIDRTDEQELKNVTEQIKEINPWAEIRFTEFCDVDSSLVFSNNVSALLERYDSSNGEDHSLHNHDHDEHHHHHHDDEHHHAHETMESFVIAPHEDVSQVELERACGQLPDNVWRMKGHMVVGGQPSLIQYSGGQLEVFEAEMKPHYRLVFIGRDLNPESIASGFGVPITDAA